MNVLTEDIDHELFDRWQCVACGSWRAATPQGRAAAALWCIRHSNEFDHRVIYLPAKRQILRNFVDDAGTLPPPVPPMPAHWTES